jgi:hypothetical protein
MLPGTCALCLLTIQGAAVPVAPAATRYVTPSEDLAAAVGTLGAGDTLVLKRGTYGSLTIGASSAAGQAITVRAEQDGEAQVAKLSLIGATNVVVEGLVAKGAAPVVVVKDSSRITIRRLSGYGTQLSSANAHVWTVDNAAIHSQDMSRVPRHGRLLHLRHACRRYRHLGQPSQALPRSLLAG